MISTKNAPLLNLNELEEWDEDNSDKETHDTVTSRSLDSLKQSSDQKESQTTVGMFIQEKDFRVTTRIIENAESQIEESSSSFWKIKCKKCFKIFGGCFSVLPGFIALATICGWKFVNSISSDNNNSLNVGTNSTEDNHKGEVSGAFGCGLIGCSTLVAISAYAGLSSLYRSVNGNCIHLSDEDKCADRNKSIASDNSKSSTSRANQKQISTGHNKDNKSSINMIVNASSTKGHQV